ncbi:MAG: alanine--tRNA ligase [Buchnera aphidicola (Chaetogeoica yunlongensis)]
MNFTSKEIRKMFLKFFHEKKHTIISGSELVNNNDSSLLFTNAGMNQFKNIFLEKNYDFKYTKVATIQKCLRTGGKHNDFENVGYTSKHHTFFEMLGNFSFRDYFKIEAISYAWEFLTSHEQLNLSKEKIWITVYKNDIESYNIWKNIIKIDDTKIIKIGDKKEKYCSDNFWQMGDTGPCGPSTEIFYDYGKNFLGTPPGYHGNSSPRFLEIWNIVFIQFNKLKNKQLIKLETPSVDTGMGLERILAVVNNVVSNYETDLFQPLIKKILSLSTKNIINNTSLYVIADHIRSSSFIISENIIPSNEKHGYILRRIIRRAIRYGHNLGIKNLFLYKLVPTLIKIMGKTEIKLKQNQTKIQNILKLEEKNFITTLDKGLKILKNKIIQLPNKILSGKLAFNLYDTCGFPIDLTIDICKEHKISVDLLEFNKYLQKHKKNSLNKNFLYTKKFYNFTLQEKDKKTIFIGYNLNNTTSIINSIIVDDNIDICIKKDQHGIVFLEKTTFYGEAGGQIGDTGIIKNDTGTFIVNDTKIFGNKIGHIGKITSGYLNKNDIVNAEIEILKRKKIQNNHSATHLLHASLRKILGTHVFQKGSFISDKIIRFDFSHDNSISLSQLHKIETIINSKIQENILIQTKCTILKKIKNKNIMALFQEKYKKIVRMVSINNFSIELCGGTHTKNTGDIGIFKIISENNVSSGIRRIEAVTGEQALLEIQKQEKTIQKLCITLNTNKINIQTEINKLLNKYQILEKKTNTLIQKQINNTISKLSKKSILKKHTNIIIECVYDENILSLRNIIDQLKNKFKSSIIVIINFLENKGIIIIGVTHDLIHKFSAKKMLKKFIEKLGGEGGGKHNLAEGKIKNLTLLPKELKKIKKWIDSKL